MTGQATQILNQRLKDFFAKYFPHKIKSTILVGLSGGLDSVVLCHILHENGFKIAAAHCNFSLRGYESEGDEIFCEEFTSQFNIPYFVQKFNTEKISSEEKLSIQETARYLRYGYFQLVLEENKFQYIATAHHVNDNVETYLMNLMRGSGVMGLKSIPPVNDNVIRPLILASRKEIENYAKENNLHWREDSSNASDDYLRNRVRHHLVPEFVKNNSNFIDHMRITIDDTLFASEIIRHYVENSLAPLIEVDEYGYFILNLQRIKALPYANNILYHSLSGYGFNTSQIADILETRQSGKIFNAGNKRLLVDRDQLIIDTETLDRNYHEQIKEDTKTIILPHGNISFSRKKINASKPLLIDKNPEFHHLDTDKLKFPLTLRKWNDGDKFQPIGMKGQKKVSDFLIDKKINLFEKENILVVTSENQIVCIVGHRIDDRFKITTATRNMYVIKSLPVL